MTAKRAVVFQLRASREDVINDWWRDNRQAAPEMFAEEIERMLAIIAALPELGVQARSVRIPGVRRVLLRHSRYHVYFRADDATVEILAVWHAERNEDPALDVPKRAMDVQQMTNVSQAT